MKTNLEFDKFSAGMKTILRANPIIVKAAMINEKQERASERKAKKRTASRSKPKN